MKEREDPDRRRCIGRRAGDHHTMQTDERVGDPYSGDAADDG